MCKHAVISPIATPGRMEFARGLGNWRCPVVGSNGAVFTIGLIHCGQRCDLDFVFLAVVVRSAPSKAATAFVCRSSCFVPLLASSLTLPLALAFVVPVARGAAPALLARLAVKLPSREAVCVGRCRGPMDAAISQSALSSRCCMYVQSVA